MIATGPVNGVLSGVSGSLAVMEPVIFVSVQSPFTRTPAQLADTVDNPTLVQGAMDLSDRMESIKITSGKGKMPTAEMKFWNEDQHLAGSPIMHHGAIVRVAWGYSGYISKVHQFRVQKVKGTRAKVANFGILTIVARGAVASMQGKAKSRTFRNMDAVDIAELLAKEHGYTGFAVELGPRKPENKCTWNQVNMTDAQFIQHMAQWTGYTFMIHGGRFIFAPEDQVNKDEAVAYYTYYTDEEGWIKRFEPESDVTVNFGTVTVKSRDPGTGKRISASASVQTRQQPTLGKHNPAVPAVEQFDAMKILGKQLGNVTANAFLQGTNTVLNVIAPNSRVARYVRSFQRRVHRASTKVLQAGTIATNQVINKPNSTARAVKSEAQTRQVQVQRRGIKARMVVIGDPDIWANFYVHVDGLAEGWSGLWKIVECEHILDRKGYEVHCKLRKDGLSSLGKGVRAKAEQTSKARSVSSRKVTRVSSKKTTTSALTLGAVSRRRYTRK